MSRTGDLSGEPGAQVHSSKVLDHFLVRLPALSIDRYHELLQRDTQAAYTDLRGALLAFFEAHPVCEEAVAVASASLRTALETVRSTPHESKKARQAVDGLLRYALRMIARPTPFGMCSGVVPGQVVSSLGSDSSSNLSPVVDVEPFPGGVQCRRVVCDSNVYRKVIAPVESDLRQRERLHYRLNPAVISEGDRYVLLYLDEVDKPGPVRTASIRAGGPARFVMEDLFIVKREPESCGSSLTLADIRSRLAERFPTADGEVINTFLNGLCEQHFLISALHGPAADGVEDWLNRLDRAGCTEAAAKMSELKACADAYERSLPGAGEADYARLRQVVEGLGGTERSVHVVSRMSGAVYVREELRASVATFDSALRAVGRPAYAATLERFRERFLDCYGDDVCVPFLKMAYQHPDWIDLLSNESHASATSEWSDLFHARLPGAQRANEFEIELFDRDFESVGKRRADGSGQQERRWAPGCEVAVSVWHRRGVSKASDAGLDWVLSSTPLGGSDEIGRTCGRFFEILGHGPLERQSAAYFQTGGYGAVDPQVSGTTAGTGTVWADLALMPPGGYASGVANSPLWSPFALCLGWSASESGSHVLPLTELNICHTRSGFEFFLHNVKQPIRIRFGHSLNLDRVAPSVRLLHLLSVAGYVGVHYPFMEETRNWIAVPRVRYGRCILRPAQWQLGAAAIRESAGQVGIEQDPQQFSDEQWSRVLANLREIYRIPRYCWAGSTDQKLLLDLEHPWCRGQLLRDARRDVSRIILQESLLDEWEPGVKGMQGRYLSEMVFQVERDQPSPPPAPSVRVELDRDADPRTFLQRWVFVKLYVHPERLDEVVAACGRHSRDLRASGLIDQWFFIRYRDPDLHVRLRVRPAQDTKVDDLYAHLRRFATLEVERGAALSMAFDMYRPEVGRYGGPHALDAIHQIFTADSDAAIAWGPSNEDTDDALVRLVAAEWLFLRALGVETRRVADIFRPVSEVQRAWYGDTYRRLQLPLSECCLPVAALQSSTRVSEVLQTRWPDPWSGLQDPFRQMMEAVQSIRHTERVHGLSDSWEHIALSLLHIHFIRFYGLNRDRERLTANLACRVSAMLQHQSGLSDRDREMRVAAAYER
jgi:thiopeptide-type bacteriocin biosynthesis protein